MDDEHFIGIATSADLMTGHSNIKGFRLELHDRNVSARHTIIQFRTEPE